MNFSPNRTARRALMAVLALLVPVQVAMFAGCGKSASDPGPACEPSACAGNEVCVDYKTDMSTGTQCLVTECDDCDCAIAEHCGQSGATCKEVENGLRLSNCFFSPV